MYFILPPEDSRSRAATAPPLVKLKLMENEENPFDGGLYLGIAGTAAALVLQVMQVIESNLLAAYASNLFGIICVALVKIHHVRAFKRQRSSSAGQGDHRVMNKTLLLIICDFLLLNLLALRAGRR